jgi:hypothetical protein
MKPPEKQYLESLVTAAKETVDLFSNKNKTKRERMVVRAFLRCLDIEFSETELVIGPEEPVDISFRSARFQIREMLGDRKRGVVLRERLKRFQAAKSINDVIDPWISSKPLSFAELSQDLAKSLSDKASKYDVEGCGKLDALVYVNLGGRHLYPLIPKLDAAVAHELDQQGWRSVSMVFVPYSAVAIGKPDCPNFLRHKAGRIRMKWPHPDGWFDP